MRERIDHRHPRLQATFRFAGEHRDDDRVAGRFRFERDLHFLETHEGLEKENVHAGIEQRRHLLAETGRAIDPALDRIALADPERSHAASDAHILATRRLQRHAGSRRVDLRDARLESKPFQARRIRAERIRLDHTRTRRHVAFVHGANAVRLGNAKLFEAAIHGHALIEQQRSHRSIAANDPLLQFVE